MKFNNLFALIHILFFLILLIACSKKPYQYVKEGDKLYNKSQFEHAIDKYNKATKSGGDGRTSLKNAGRVYYNMAESYRKSNRIHKTAQYYKKAYKYGHKKDSSLYFYAVGMQADGNYKKAHKLFKEYIKRGDNKEFIENAKQRIETLKDIEKILEEPPLYRIEPVDYLNTKETEYSPVMRNGNIVFSSSRRGDMHGLTGTGFTHIFEYKPKAGKKGKGKVKQFSKVINENNVNEGCPTFTPDGKTMVFSKSNKKGGNKNRTNTDLFISHLKNNKWSEPEYLSINDSSAWESTPMFTPDGKYLYFSSDRNGGYGKADIYKTKYKGNNEFGEVKNIGKPVNSPENEMFPYVHNDGKLFFSTDAHHGLGGLDIFVREEDKKGNKKIKDLGPPVNSSYDDFAVYLKDNDTGFFCSNRPAGKGHDDIYKMKPIQFHYYKLKGVTMTTPPNSSKQKVLPNTYVKIINETDGGKVVFEDTTGKDGKFSTDIKTEKKFTIIAKNNPKRYFTYRDTYSTIGKSKPSKDIMKRKGDTVIFNTTVKLNLQLEQIELEKTYELENIYYEYDKARITEKASKELDKLVQILKDNPQIKVELGSHTDERGSMSYNQKLSQRRADSAVQYIVNQGISENRIIAQGYGESQPVIENADSEEEHQKNRRTEFKVIEVEGRREEQ